ncbi:MAG TPA: hypothetical protein VKZ55_11525, partial [Microthrixaceae bacterium]|nr:hypothetical protein [Microthrixaceae bacterium]
MRRVVSQARGPGRVVAIAITAMAMVLTSMVFGQLQAGAQTVGNPGEFSMEIIGGEIAIKDTSFDLEPSELPACSDGEDNDDDGLIDYPDDPQCAGPDDNSELAAGHQPKEDITISGTIDADGNINVPTSGVFFPPSYIAAEGMVITVRILPTHAATGTLDPATGDANIRVRVRIKLEGGSGLTGLGSNCYIGSPNSPIDLNITTGTTNPPAPNTPISGVPYDAE